MAPSSRSFSSAARSISGVPASEPGVSVMGISSIFPESEPDIWFGKVSGAATLVPDFKGDWAALQTVVDARPDILNHNVETVPRLYRQVRSGARLVWPRWGTTSQGATCLGNRRISACSSCAT